DLAEGLGKEVAILAGLERLDAGTEPLDAVLLEEAQPLHLDTAGQGGLAAKGQEYTIGPLLLNDPGHVLGGDGDEVDLDGGPVLRLGGRDVGVVTHCGDTGLLERRECVGSCSPRLADCGRVTRGVCGEAVRGPW